MQVAAEAEAQALAALVALVQAVLVAAVLAEVMALVQPDRMVKAEAAEAALIWQIQAVLVVLV